MLHVLNRISIADATVYQVVPVDYDIMYLVMNFPDTALLLFHTRTKTTLKIMKSAIVVKCFGSY
jgi:hypothetical protein